MKDVTRTFDLPEWSRERYNKPDALNSKADGKWIGFSSAQYYDLCRRFACGVMSMGLQKGDRVVLISNNRPEWNIIDLGLAQAGVVNVPVYPTISDDEYAYILSHALPVLVIVSDKTLYGRLQKLVPNVPSVRKLYTINEVEDAENWKEIMRWGAEKCPSQTDLLEQRKSSIKPDDVATIIYTSGTTGIPKGVMLTHSNLVSNFKSAGSFHPFGPEHRALSFLPLCHVFERMVNYHFQYRGISIYYAENLGTIGENIREVKPHVFISVPRIIEGVYDKIMAKGKDLPLIQKAIFSWAVNLGLKFDYTSRKTWLYKVMLQIADRLVFTKWRDALGGETGLIIVGGAALQPRLSRLFGAAGIPLLEGYGLTETSPVIAANNISNGKIRIGTVGQVFDGVRVKIASDGEILCKGPNVMKGYYLQPEMTAEVIDNEGWFHTGDIGTLDSDGFLKITDRKKEMFKLSNGKYVAPQPIENKFKEIYLIEQIMVVGENEKFASAIISPNFRSLHYWCMHHHIRFRDNAELVRHPQVIRKYQEEVDRINRDLGLTEQIKRFKLVTEEWSAATGELSPTLKLRRNVLKEKYATVLQEIYTVRN